MAHAASRNSLLAGLLLLAQGALSACVVDTAAGKSRADDEATGHLSLALTGGSSSGDSYRLRDATIELLGTSEAMFSSEDYLDQNVIQVDLPAGGYLARLQPGWRLEHAVGMGWEDVPARLISTNPLPFEVFDQQVTNVVLRFQAGEQVIELGDGRLLLSIFVDDDIAPPPDGDCEMACAEAQLPECANQDLCVPICQDLPALLQAPGCETLAQDYVDCAAGEPGASYVCLSDYPVAGACDLQFQAVIDCAVGMCTDADGDGSCQESGDCNDADASVSPNLPEICGDAVDNDCDGAIDSGDGDCGMVPTGWSCSSGFYGADDGCDCGCGVTDPDCADSSVASCDFCDDAGSCSQEPGCPGAVNAMDNASCL